MVKLCIKQLLLLVCSSFFIKFFPLINYYLEECQVGFIIKAEVDPQNMIQTQNLLTLFMHFARFGFGPQLKLEGGHHLLIIKYVIFIIILQWHQIFSSEVIYNMDGGSFLSHKKGQRNLFKKISTSTFSFYPIEFCIYWILLFIVGPTYFIIKSIY